MTAAYHEVGEPPPDLTPAGALSELCHSSGPYDSGATNVRPYIKEQVSWPGAASSPMPMAEGHPADMQWMLDWRAHLLRPPSEVCDLRAASPVKQPHMDPHLRYSAKEYDAFLDTLHISTGTTRIHDTGASAYGLYEPMC